MQLSANISILWKELFMESRQVDRSLVKVKKTFAEVVPIIYQLLIYFVKHTSYLIFELKTF